MRRPFWTVLALVGNAGNGLTAGTEIRSDRLINGIAQIPNITQPKTHWSPKPAGSAEKIQGFSLADKRGFYKCPSETVIFTVTNEGRKSRKHPAEPGFWAADSPDCVKVSVVGAGMAGMPG